MSEWCFSTAGADKKEPAAIPVGCGWLPKGPHSSNRLHAQTRTRLEKRLGLRPSFSGKEPPNSALKPGSPRALPTVALPRQSSPRPNSFSWKKAPAGTRSPAGDSHSHTNQKNSSRDRHQPVRDAQVPAGPQCQVRRPIAPGAPQCPAAETQTHPYVRAYGRAPRNLSNSGSAPLVRGCINPW
jgi:hypothetical protein